MYSSHMAILTKRTSGFVDPVFLALAWYPMTAFVSAHQEHIAWSTIFAKHQFLFNSFFEVTVNNTNDGRTSKLSEYNNA